MVRARRLSSIAAIAMLGVAVLAGCGRADPAVAAYVGATEIAEEQLTRIVDEFVAAAPEEQREALLQTGIDEQVLHLLIIEQVAREYAAANDVKIEEPDVEGTAQQSGLPPNLAVTELLASYNAAFSALSQTLEPVAPSEADRREAYDNTTVEGQPLEQPYDEVKQAFNEETLGRAVAMRDLLDDAVADANVTVNPRHNAVYQLRVPIESSAVSWFPVALGGVVPVTDAAAEQPAPEASGQG